MILYQISKLPALSIRSYFPENEDYGLNGSILFGIGLV